MPAIRKMGLLGLFMKRKKRMAGLREPAQRALAITGISQYIRGMTQNEPIFELDGAARLAEAFRISLRYPCNNNVLRKATRHLGQLFDDVMVPSGLRAAQHGLLVHIRDMGRPTGGPTMKDLAHVLVMDLSALGHTLKPLMRDGFVELRVDDRDRRVKRVYLTALGEAKLAETSALWRKAQARLETALGSDRAQQLRDLLAIVASREFGEAFVAGTPLPDHLSPCG
jgi:DNA-binding MarR family transcriptional regulator